VHLTAVVGDEVDLLLDLALRGALLEGNDVIPRHCAYLRVPQDVKAIKDDQVVVLGWQWWEGGSAERRIN